MSKQDSNLEPIEKASRDELQAVIGALRATEFPVSLQFVNFRE